MELKEILAISGQPGLYKYVAQSTNGVIVESLLDGRRMNASASSKVSSLTEISMFTEGEDIALADVFTKIYAHTGGKEAISPKEAPEKLKAAFAEVLPEYDRDRVHVSDMKKCFAWYNILVRAGFTEFKLRSEGEEHVSRRLAGAVGCIRCDSGFFHAAKFAVYIIFVQ